MSDMIRSGAPHIPKVQPSEIKPQKEQISKSLDNFWKPLVDFFKEEETSALEEKLLNDGIHSAVDAFKTQEAELRQTINANVKTGNNLNILS